MVDPEQAWRRWLVIFCGTFAGAGLLLYTLLLLIDPYDTGRFPGFAIVGTGDHTLKTAAASHGRDQRFNATVIGNSTGQLLDPFRISRETGLRLTQLAIAGTGPREQLTIMRWVISHHPKYEALIVVTDTTWCTSDPDPPLMDPFPFWLYGSHLEYIANLLNPKALDNAAYRLRIALGLMQPADPVAYFDYSAAVGIVFTPEPVAPDQQPVSGQAVPRFPWINRLNTFLATLPSNIRVVLAMPPVYFTKLRQPGTAEAIRIDACKAAFSQTASTRLYSRFIDFRIDMDLTHDSTDFIDPFHYRHRLAHMMETKIVTVLSSSEMATSEADKTPRIAAKSQPNHRAP